MERGEGGREGVGKGVGKVAGSDGMALMRKKGGHGRACLAALRNALVETTIFNVQIIREVVDRHSRRRRHDDFNLSSICWVSNLTSCRCVVVSLCRHVSTCVESP